MRKDELIEMMSIWIDAPILSKETIASCCANVAEIYHAEQLRLLSVGKSVKEKNIPTFKEYLEINFVRTKESRYKCIYTKTVYSRDAAFKNYKQAFNVKP